MNFIVVGVIAPIAYFLIRILVKRLVQNFILNAKKNSKVAEVQVCQKCGVFKSTNDLTEKNNTFICKNDCSK
jgi:formylmethanofuran dehydrogenase subunit E